MSPAAAIRTVAGACTVDVACDVEKAWGAGDPDAAGISYTRAATSKKS
jgi:hypothetical protein